MATGTTAFDQVDLSMLFVDEPLASARRFLERAINLHDVPEKITLDKSGANTAGMVCQSSRC